jgi:hypothetical protein
MDMIQKLKNSSVYIHFFNMIHVRRAANCLICVVNHRDTTDLCSNHEKIDTLNQKNEQMDVEGDQRLAQNKD